MVKKEYVSKIDRPVNHTTSKGGSYVEPFDVIRSTAGRAAIASHAESKRSIARLPKGVRKTYTNTRAASARKAG